MKITHALILAALLAAPSAQAASIKEIFQSIAEAAEPGNGNGHNVTQADAPFNEKREISKINKAVNPAHPKKDDCRFDVYADVEGGLQEIKSTWHSPEIAARLAGLARKGLIKQIVYSVWDSSTGDNEYCSLSTMNVFAIDGTVLNFDFNETD